MDGSEQMMDGNRKRTESSREEGFWGEGGGLIFSSKRPNTDWLHVGLERKKSRGKKKSIEDDGR